MNVLQLDSKVDMPFTSDAKSGHVYLCKKGVQRIFKVPEAVMAITLMTGTLMELSDMYPDATFIRIFGIVNHKEHLVINGRRTFVDHSFLQYLEARGLNDDDQGIWLTVVYTISRAAEVIEKGLDCD